MPNDKFAKIPSTLTERNPKMVALKLLSYGPNRLVIGFERGYSMVYKACIQGKSREVEQALRAAFNSFASTEEFKCLSLQPGVELSLRLQSLHDVFFYYNHVSSKHRGLKDTRALALEILDDV